MRAGVDIQTVLDVGDGHARGFGVDQRGIRTARQQGMLAHPQELRFELVGALDWVRRGRNDIAAAGIDIIFKDQGDRLPRGRYLLGASGDNDFLNRAGHSRWTDAHVIARLDRSAGNAPRESAEIQVGPINPLHRHGKGLCRLMLLARNAFEPIAEE